MRLPTYEELSNDKEQLDVLEAPLDKALFVVGPPGSGKTSLAVWRGEALAELYGRAPPVITYSRMLRRTLLLVADAHEINICALTMHSYVWRDFQQRTRDPLPTVPPDPYEYDWDTMIGRLAVTEPDREALVVDEGQDLPSGFFAYAACCVTETMSVFADEEQTIGRNGSTLAQIKRAAGLPNPVLLSENHRNTAEIARLAEHFHRGRLPAATVTRSGIGDIPQLTRSDGEATTAERIATEFRNRAGSVGVIVSLNATGKAIQRALRERLPNVRIDRYSHRKANEDSIDVRQPGVTVLNKESVKGQEFDSVFILELERFIPCRSDADFRAMYMMCTRARDHLFLVYGPRPLSTEITDALPGVEVLVR